MKPGAWANLRMREGKYHYIHRVRCGHSYPLMGGHALYYTRGTLVSGRPPSGGVGQGGLVWVGRSKLWSCEVMGPTAE
jgi:hypothetical protein